MCVGQQAFEPSGLVRVLTRSGWLVGSSDGKVSMFKGIPYAAPPVGLLRWRPPQAPTKWHGERLALAPGPAPMQVLPTRSSLMYRLNNDDATALVMSEDCLYLNLWSPAPSRDSKLPVLVWVHGGANKTGHGGQELFDGTRLAARGMVVVTLNMRLGALGFLALPELAAEDPLGAAGNYGMQDVLAALSWVQDNIAAFGGDAARVTLAGNSAGAATVTHLMAAPAACGLFRSAIAQSLSGIFRHEPRMAPLPQAMLAGQAAVDGLGKSLQQLRDLPATAFLRIGPHAPMIDGRLLTEDTADVFLAGRQMAIPLLAGWNADEGSLFNTHAALAELNLASYSESAKAALENVYPRAAEDDGLVERSALIGDRRFIFPVWRTAQAHVKTSGAPSWLYQFTHRLPLPEARTGTAGVFHTAELPYSWDNLAARPWDWDAADHAVAKTVADAWYRFVAHGDPNGGILPYWPQFDDAPDANLMMLGMTPTPARVPRRQAFDLFDANIRG